MRVFFPYDPRISRAMERIRQAFIRYAPPGMEFVNSPGPSDIHVINWVGQNPREHHPKDEQLQAAPTLPLTSKFIVLLHNGNWFWPQYEREFQDLMRRASLIVTYSRDLLGFDIPGVLETPWGIDPEIFYRAPMGKTWTIMATGYVADGEGIDAIFNACYIAQLSMIHVGGVLNGSWVQPTYTRVENVSDQDMRSLYNRSRFVSGLRRDGGFELPAIEGYACGCQPIVFDHPHMKRHYGDFATFVPSVPRQDLARILIPILREPKDLTPDQAIVSRFHWDRVMGKIWNRILEV